MNKINDKLISKDKQQLERIKSTLKNLFNLRYVYLQSSGSQSIVNAVKVLKLKMRKKKLKVAFPNITHPSIINGIISEGGIPYPIDIDLKNLCLNYSILESILKTNEIDLLIAVHMFGNFLDFTRLLNLKEKYGFLVIEDISQIIGNEYEGTELSDITVSSLSDGKPFSVEKGKLGFLGFRNPVYLKILNEKENLEIKEKNLNALIAKFESRNEIMKKIRSINLIYFKLKKLKYLIIPDISVYTYELPVLTKYRNDLKNYLVFHNVPLEKIYYPLSKHKSNSIKGFESSYVYHRMALHLPNYPMIDERGAENAVEKIREFFGH